MINQFTGRVNKRVERKRNAALAVLAALTNPVQERTKLSKVVPNRPKSIIPARTKVIAVENDVIDEVDVPAPKMSLSQRLRKASQGVLSFQTSSTSNAPQTSTPNTPQTPNRQRTSTPNTPQTPTRQRPSTPNTPQTPTRQRTSIKDIKPTMMTPSQRRNSLTSTYIARRGSIAEGKSELLPKQMFYNSRGKGKGDRNNDDSNEQTEPSSNYDDSTIPKPKPSITKRTFRTLETFRDALTTHVPSLNLLIPYSLSERSPWRSDPLSISTFKTLNLTNREVEKLYKCYKRIDTSHDGTISSHEFLDFCGVPISSFALRAFSVMDEDGSGELDFREFVISTWNYCTNAKNGLILFAYELYDADYSGMLSLDEVYAMFTDVFGEQFQHTKSFEKIYAKIVQIGHRNEDTYGFLTKVEFVEVIGGSMHVLLPAFQMQIGIQKAILGLRFWKRLAKKRSKNTENSTSLDFKSLSTKDNPDTKTRIRTIIPNKIDTKQIMKAHHKEVNDEMISEIKNTYVSKLINRLGDYNPSLSTNSTRRIDNHNKVKELNLSVFEDLEFNRNARIYPEVLWNRDVYGKSLHPDFEVSISQSTLPNKELVLDGRKVQGIENSVVANQGRWDNGEGGKTWDDEICEIKMKNLEMFNVSKGFRGMASIAEVKNGYEVKDSFEVKGRKEGIVVDERSKIVDWRGLMNGQGSLNSVLS